jgi:hypothetical protein
MKSTTSSMKLELTSKYASGLQLLDAASSAQNIVDLVKSTTSMRCTEIDVMVSRLVRLATLATRLAIKKLEKVAI